MTTLIDRFSRPAALLPTPSQRDAETVQFAKSALASAKREGLQLAVRARHVALAVIGCLLMVINPVWEQLYYVALLGLFALTYTMLLLYSGRANIARVADAAAAPSVPAMLVLAGLLTRGVVAVLW